jgi:putative thiamine transport system permease protein
MDKAVHALTGLSVKPYGRGLGRICPSVLSGFIGLVVAMPVVAGFLATLSLALGYLPALGGHAFTLAPFRSLFAYPGLWSSLWLTLSTGVTATVLALVLASAIAAVLHDRLRTFSDGLLVPFLAVPHAAVAIGLVFVLAPSGWLARLASPWLTGWRTPPAVAFVNDAHGVALVLGLLIKEVPYLLLVLLAAFDQIPIVASLKVARSLGYGRTIGWVKVVFPLAYRQIRGPLILVLAYSLSVVDMAVILGPSNPPTLAVLAFRWFSAPDLGSIFQASAAAILLFGLVGAAGLLLQLVGLLLGSLGQIWLARGGRGAAGSVALGFVATAALAPFCLGCLALLSLVLWSFAGNWRFPDLLPSTWRLSSWSHLDSLAEPFANSLGIAVIVTIGGLVLVIAWFECDDHCGRRLTPRLPRLAYVPLFLPQIAFVFGLQIPLLWLGFEGTRLAVAWAHLVFVVPYMMITLAEPWRALDPRFARAARALGATKARTFFMVKLPLLLRPLLVTGAVGFAVSFNQYLASLFPGAGHVPTLTSEAVALASGADRRVVALYAVLLALPPMTLYGLALIIPALRTPRRQGANRR